MASRRVNEVELSEIAAFTGVQVNIIINKIEELINSGQMKGLLDKLNRKFYSALDHSSSQVPEESKIDSEVKMQIPTPQTKEKLFGSKQVDFIKTEIKETSQEDLVKLVVNIGYAGSHLRTGVQIFNNSNNLITELNVKLLFSETLSLFKIKPDYEIKELESGISIRLPNLNPKSKIHFNIYFKSDSLGIGNIKGQFQYVNNQDYVRFIRIDDLYYNLTPPNILPYEITSEQIELFTQQIGIKKDIRSYGLPDEMHPYAAFNHLKQIVSTQFNFKLLTEHQQEDINIAWLCGITNEGNVEEDIVMVVCQVLNNKIEMYASSFNEQVISSLLTAFSISLKKRLVNSNVVSDESEIFELYCQKCGGVLPLFPKPGEKIYCKWCGTENNVR